MLRTTGMPVADVKLFMATGPQRAQTSSARLTVLEDHAERLQGRIAELTAAAERVTAKIEQHKRLSAAGLECEDLQSDPPSP